MWLPASEIWHLHELNETFLCPSFSFIPCLGWDLSSSSIYQSSPFAISWSPCHILNFPLNCSVYLEKICSILFLSSLSPSPAMETGLFPKQITILSLSLEVCKNGLKALLLSYHDANRCRFPNLPLKLACEYQHASEITCWRRGGGDKGDRHINIIFSKGSLFSVSNMEIKSFLQEFWCCGKKYVLRVKAQVCHDLAVHLQASYFTFQTRLGPTIDALLTS